MVDYRSVQEWLNNYVRAWESYDPAAIGALFSEDAVYRYGPYHDGLRGRDAIVKDWLDNRDSPGTYKADYHPIAVDGDTAVAQGRSYYYESDKTTLRREFDNIFVLKFDRHGRCTEFCEWFMQPRGQS